MELRKRDEGKHRGPEPCSAVLDRVSRDARETTTTAALTGGGSRDAVWTWQDTRRRSCGFAGVDGLTIVRERSRRVPSRELRKRPGKRLLRAELLGGSEEERFDERRKRRRRTGKIYIARLRYTYVYAQRYCCVHV